MIVTTDREKGFNLLWPLLLFLAGGCSGWELWLWPYGHANSSTSSSVIKFPLHSTGDRNRKQTRIDFSSVSTLRRLVGTYCTVIACLFTWAIVVSARRGQSVWLNMYRRGNMPNHRNFRTASSFFIYKVHFELGLGRMVYLCKLNGLQTKTLHP